MAKRVLISLDDIKNLWDNPNIYGMREFRNIFKEWFDAQPDASPPEPGLEQLDASNYPLGFCCMGCFYHIRTGVVHRHNMNKMFVICDKCRKEALSKMETTGDEDDN